MVINQNSPEEDRVQKTVLWSFSDACWVAFRLYCVAERVVMIQVDQGKARNSDQGNGNGNQISKQLQWLNSRNFV